MKILLIEDDAKLAKELKKKLEHDFFVVDIADNGERGSFLARTSSYDLIILDNILPKKEGKDVLHEIRDDKKNTLILVLSIKFEPGLKTELLNAGADDYMQKPYSYQELKARINALLRRATQINNVVMKIGALEIDTGSYSVKYLNKNITLTRKEFLFLEYLGRNKNRVVSRGGIIENVWDVNADLFSNAIEATVLRLRKKFKKITKVNIIETINGVGYRIKC